jgi:hypothetical protein
MELRQPEQVDLIMQKTRHDNKKSPAIFGMRLFAVISALVSFSIFAQYANAATRKAPYLIYPGNNTQMEVLWQLTVNDTCIIKWGTDTTYSLGNQQTFEYGTDHQHKFTILGLTPGTKYFYRVDISGELHSGSFQAAPPDTASRVKFFAYGDTRSYPATHNQAAAGMVSTYTLDPAYQTLALSVGDLVNSGNTESDWDNQFFSPAYSSIQAMLANMPYQSAMGNHEGTGLLFVKYFPYPFVGGRYWSFDYGPAHFAIVDQYTSYGPGSPQLQWLTNDLAASTKPWKFICLHEPGWSAGGDHPNNTSVQNYIQPLCLQYGVSIVFGGHNHYYARAVVNGVEHLTIGGGGAPLYSPNPTYPNIVATSMSYHYTKIEINATFLKFAALTPAGAVIDTFSLGSANGTIAGMVTDVRGPVAGAIITANDGLGHTGTDTTAADGIYFLNITASTYNLTFHQSDHRDTTVSGVVVDIADTTLIDMAMIRLKGGISGTVTAGGSGAIADVRVLIPGLSFEDTTVANGFYALDSLVDSTYDVMFSNPNYRDTTVTGVVVLPGHSTTLNMTMRKLPGWLGGTITDTSGIPLESVYVRINPLTPRRNLYGRTIYLEKIMQAANLQILSVDSLYTDVNGQYLSMIPWDIYDIRFSKHGYRDTSVTGVTVVQNDTTMLSLGMRPYDYPPVITSSAIDTATENILFKYVATAADSDDAILSIDFSNYPAWLHIGGDTISGMPPVGASDTTFRIIASDGQKSDTLVVIVIIKSACEYLLGDINGDDLRLGGDVTYGVRFFKQIGNRPPDSCYMDSTHAYLYVAGDVNGNCEFRASDITRLVAYFKNYAELSYCHFFAPALR